MIYRVINIPIYEENFNIELIILKRIAINNNYKLSMIEYFPQFYLNKQFPKYFLSIAKPFENKKTFTCNGKIKNCTNV